MLDLGTPFHGEFSSADASALSEPNSRIQLYGANFDSGGAAITLTATDQVIITDITVSVGATGVIVTVYDGTTNAFGAGKVISKLNLAANGVARESAYTPHYCDAGTWPKVKTSGAGQVDVIIRGRILNTAP